MGTFVLGTLKIEKDKSGNYWIAEYSKERPGVSKISLTNDTLRVFGEMIDSLVDLDRSDWKLKKDIYIAFIGHLGRWVSSWRDPLLDLVIKAWEAHDLGVECWPEGSKICIGSISVIEAMQNTLCLLDNDTFRAALGGNYEQLSETDIEELKHLLYELASAVIKAHRMECKTQNVD